VNCYKKCEAHYEHVVLCGYELWSLIVWEECKLQILEIEVLRKIF